jgi:hypothetical protein
VITLLIPTSHSIGGDLPGRDPKTAVKCDLPAAHLE